MLRIHRPKLLGPAVGCPRLLYREPGHHFMIPSMYKQRDEDVEKMCLSCLLNNLTLHCSSIASGVPVVL